MTDVEVVLALSRTGMVPKMPFVVISNNDGRVQIESVPAEEYHRRMWAGVYGCLLGCIPEQDRDGRWLNVPANGVIVIKGMLATVVCKPAALS